MQTGTEVTTTTHIFFSIACACFAWCLMVKPAMRLLTNSKKFTDFLLIIFTLIIYCLIIPGIMMADKAYDLNIYGENEFRLMKFLSVVGAILIIQVGLCYVYMKDGKGWSVNILTVITYILFIINILEASSVSFKNKDKPDFDGTTELPEMNLILGIASVIMVVLLLINVFRGDKVGMSLQGLQSNELRLQCGFSWFMILAYTFWNFGFKIQEIESPLVLMFLVVSLILPVAAKFFKVGDWLQVRGLTLLFAIIVELGFSKDSSIFPLYNKTGYDEQKTKDSPISKVFANRDFKLFLVVMTILCLFGEIVRMFRK